MHHHATGFPLRSRGTGVAIAGLATILALTAGCGSAPTGSAPAGSDPGSLIVTAMMSNEANFPRGGSFVFDPRSTMRTDSRLRTTRVDDMMREALSRAMIRRGFTPAVDLTPDIVVAYAAGLGATLDDAALDELFGVSSASLPTDHSSYEKGALIVELYDPFFRRTLWRGAVQGAVTIDLTDEVRQQRIIRAVEQLMLKFQPVL